MSCRNGHGPKMKKVLDPAWWNPALVQNTKEPAEHDSDASPTIRTSTSRRQSLNLQDEEFKKNLPTILAKVRPRKSGLQAFKKKAVPVDEPLTPESKSRKMHYAVSTPSHTVTDKLLEWNMSCIGQSPLPAKERVASTSKASNPSPEKPKVDIISNITVRKRFSQQKPAIEPPLLPEDVKYEPTAKIIKLDKKETVVSKSNEECVCNSVKQMLIKGIRRRKSLCRQPLDAFVVTEASPPQGTQWDVQVASILKSGHGSRSASQESSMIPVKPVAMKDVAVQSDDDEELPKRDGRDTLPKSTSVQTTPTLESGCLPQSEIIFKKPAPMMPLKEIISNAVAINENQWKSTPILQPPCAVRDFSSSNSVRNIAEEYLLNAIKDNRENQAPDAGNKKAVPRLHVVKQDQGNNEGSPNAAAVFPVADDAMTTPAQLMNRPKLAPRRRKLEERAADAVIKVKKPMPAPRRLIPSNNSDATVTNGKSCGYATRGVAIVEEDYLVTEQKQGIITNRSANMSPVVVLTTLELLPNNLETYKFIEQSKSCAKLKNEIKSYNRKGLPVVEVWRCDDNERDSRKSSQEREETKKRKQKPAADSSNNKSSAPPRKTNKKRQKSANKTNAKKTRAPFVPPEQEIVLEDVRCLIAEDWGSPDRSIPNITPELNPPDNTDEISANPEQVEPAIQEEAPHQVPKKRPSRKCPAPRQAREPSPLSRNQPQRRPKAPRRNSAKGVQMVTKVTFAEFCGNKPEAVKTGKSRYGRNLKTTIRTDLVYIVDGKIENNLLVMDPSRPMHNKKGPRSGRSQKGQKFSRLSKISEVTEPSESMKASSSSSKRRRLENECPEKSGSVRDDSNSVPSRRYSTSPVPITDNVMKSSLYLPPGHATENSVLSEGLIHGFVSSGDGVLRYNCSEVPIKYHSTFAFGPGTLYGFRNPSKETTLVIQKLVRS